MGDVHSDTPSLLPPDFCPNILMCLRIFDWMLSNVTGEYTAEGLVSDASCSETNHTEHDLLCSFKAFGFCLDE